METQQIALTLNKGLSRSGGFLSKIVGFIFRNWRFSITAIIVTIILFGSIIDSVHKQSPEPFFINFVGMFVAPDEKIYYNIDNINETYPTYEEPNFKSRWTDMVAHLKYYFNVLLWYFGIMSALWMIYYVGYVIFKIYHNINTSAVYRALTLTIITMIILQIMFANFIFIYKHAGQKLPEVKELIKDKDFKMSYVAFKGVGTLGFYITTNPKYLMPYNKLKHKYAYNSTEINSTKGNVKDVIREVIT